MQLPQATEVKGLRVLTTKQLAEAYGTEPRILQYNFRYNKSRYIAGKHYIEISGQELRDLKRRSEIQSSFKQAKILYLWTEKGALLHAKSLNADKAWEVYDYLVDHYFRSTEVIRQLSNAQPTVTKPQPLLPAKQPSAKLTEEQMRMSQEVTAEMRKYLAAIDALLSLAEEYTDVSSAKKIRYTIPTATIKLTSLAFKLDNIASVK